MKDFPIHYSSDGSISISDSVLIQVSGDDDEAKSVLVSWSHQVSRGCLLINQTNQFSNTTNSFLKTMIHINGFYGFGVVFFLLQDEDIGSFLLQLLREDPSLVQAVWKHVPGLA